MAVATPQPNHFIASIDKLTSGDHDEHDIDMDSDLSSSTVEPLKQVCNRVVGEHSEDDDSESGAGSTSSSIKCSATQTMDRDIPDFDYTHLVARLRELILEDHEKNPGFFNQSDINKLKGDDWAVARYLLRFKLDMTQAQEMMRRSLRFKNESLCHSIKAADFPAEFYQIGGMFRYEPDRRGNRMLYFRVKLHKKVPEIMAVLQAFFYHNLMSLDEEAGGKGLSFVFDCTGGGLANADMDMLMYIFSTLNNYFPKGISYFLVHELPWILKPFWHIAKNWIPEEKRDLIKFSDSKSIFEYVDKENLPDFMGGTCKRNYKQPPENCTTLHQASKLWGIDKSIVKRTILKFAEHLPPETLESIRDFDSDVITDQKGNEDSDQENKP